MSDRAARRRAARAARKGGAEAGGPSPGDDGPSPGLVSAIVDGWRRGFAASMRRELAEERGEPRLFAYVMAGCLVLWLSRLPDAVERSLRAGPDAVEPPPLTLLIAADLFSMLFFTPLFLYAVAALARLGLRAVGGTGGWRETRTVVFWSLLLAAPALLLGAALGQSLRLAGLPDPAGDVPGVLAGALWLWIWCVGVAEAHGLRRAWPVFAVLAGVAATLLLLEPGAIASG